MPEKEITTINRAYISIVPKQPYFDWVNEVFNDSTPLTAADKEATAYAIQDDFVVKDISTVVKRHFPIIFEMELFGVCTDPDTWPTERTWKMFQAWFEFHVGSMVWDLYPEEPLEHDEV
ncbi:MAG: hypothetical protein H6590_06605 [Flavobacteriales bacterium]|nr:hypothetical protein [Flavobacteriales bacterium]